MDKPPLTKERCSEIMRSLGEPPPHLSPLKAARWRFRQLVKQTRTPIEEQKK